MDKIKITSLKERKDVAAFVAKDGRRVSFVIAGNADPTLKDLAAKVTPDGGHPVAASWVRQRQQGGRTRWAALFTAELADGKKCEVTVTATDGGKPVTAKRGFKVRRREAAEQKPASGKALPMSISVASHAPGDDITDEANEFNPYGSLTHALVSAKMLKGAQTIPAPDTFDDPGTLQFWTAFFPPIGSGTWELKAEDNVPGHVAVVGGLVVR